jgi:hypothetical protein
MGYPAESSYVLITVSAPIEANISATDLPPTRCDPVTGRADRRG